MNIRKPIYQNSIRQYESSMAADECFGGSPVNVTATIRLRLVRRGMGSTELSTHGHRSEAAVESKAPLKGRKCRSKGEPTLLIFSGHTSQVRPQSELQNLRATQKRCRIVPPAVPSRSEPKGPNSKVTRFEKMCSTGYPANRGHGQSRAVCQLVCLVKDDLSNSYQDSV